MNSKQAFLAESLYWDIRKLGYSPDNDRILAILEKAYNMGFTEGYVEREFEDD